MSEQRLIDSLNKLLDDPQSSTTSILTRAGQLADLVGDATHSKLFEAHLHGALGAESSRLLEENEGAYRMFFADRRQTGQTTSLTGSLDSLEESLSNFDRDLETALSDLEIVKDTERKVGGTMNRLKVDSARHLVGILRTNRSQLSEIIARIRARAAKFVRERENSLYRGDGSGTIETEPSTIHEFDFEKVFIVHGHDTAVKMEVTRFLERLSLEPIILHEQPNKGRTIIEKFEDYSDVGFAVVLLTPDDQGCPTPSSPAGLTPRARQNVVFELGFFFAKLRRARVCALYSEGVELPSDISGVLYVPLDPGGGWQLILARELKAAGMQVDLNQLCN